MNKEMFNELLESINEGKEILNGKIKPSRQFEFDSNEIKKIRTNLNLSQDKFANQLGISLGTLKNWEQGRRRPTGPSYVLLKIAEKNPEIFNNIFN